MLDLRFIRENPEIVKENIRRKFQDRKLPLVDEVIQLDQENRTAKQEADALRARRNALSKSIGGLMAQGKREEAEDVKKQVNEGARRLQELEAKEAELETKIREILLTIPNIIDPSVPIGRDDTENVEVTRYGEPFVPDFEIPYHTDIMERLHGIDLDSARRVAGNGFYYLTGDIARLHSAVISYARDFMIDRGFTYCIPPFMIRGNVATGVMSFDEMDAMMYKIEGPVPKHGYPCADAGMLLGRSGGPEGKILRCGGMVPAPEKVFRSRKLFQSGRRAGSSSEDSRKRQRRQVSAPYLKQHGCGAAADADRVS